ncbi:unnamed protein product [Trichogramma brassicae]|uniref:Reverse transcriptase RNase H-like domain-containing protein n=1 Tax=Trichogramma brassicae TaxID=86971 RepID=A0A6H5IEN8_9HYME|nr:unnamed protein product [Trichogramma brassicae]
MVETLLAHDDNAAGLVFPTEVYFDEVFRPKETNFCFSNTSKLRLMSSAVYNVQLLQNRGFVLLPNVARKIVAFIDILRTYVFRLDITQRTREEEHFAEEVKKLMVTSARSLYYVAQLGPAEETRELTRGKHYIAKTTREKAAKDWYSCMILKHTVNSEWTIWKCDFNETFGGKGWSPIRYALSFRYQSGSLLEYAIKKERSIKKKTGPTKRSPKIPPQTFTDHLCWFSTSLTHFGFCGAQYLYNLATNLFINAAAANIDASLQGIAAILKQPQRNGPEGEIEEKPVAYFSRKLNETQKKKKAIYLECLAIKEAISYWHHWLFGRPFKVFSDHKPLEKMNIKVRADEELGDLGYYLSQYDFQVYKRTIEDRTTRVRYSPLSKRARYLYILYIIHGGRDSNYVKGLNAITETTATEDTQSPIAIKYYYSSRTITTNNFHHLLEYGGMIWIWIKMSTKLSEQALMSALRRRGPKPLPPPSVRKIDLQQPASPQATRSSSQEAGRLLQKKCKFRCTSMRKVWNKVSHNHPLYSGTGPSTLSHVGALPPLRRAPKRHREYVVKIFRPWTNEKFYFVKRAKPLLEAASGRRMIVI